MYFKEFHGKIIIKNIYINIRLVYLEVGYGKNAIIEKFTQEVIKVFLYERLKIAFRKYLLDYFLRRDYFKIE